MNALVQPMAAIVDYGLGNLFSVQRACEYVGLPAHITSSRDEVLQADAVILPGVGAFGDAMAALHRLDLVSPLQDIAASGKPLIGICLGLQLLMSESYEFGTHAGLNIIQGPVVRFENPVSASGTLKVPQIGWNRICKTRAQEPGQHNTDGDEWSGSPLAGLPDGEFMYFVHSFYAQPDELDVVLSTSRYGHITFCSSLKKGNVFASQFHPERSGSRGLDIYRNIAALIHNQKERNND